MTGAAESVGIAWTPLVQRGLIGLVFGAAALLGRDPSWAGVLPILLFYAMADGLLAIGGAARAAYAHEPCVGGTLAGVAGLGGVLLVGVWPGANSQILIGCVAVWAVVTAAVAAFAIRERRLAEGALVLLRFSVVAIAGARAGHLGVALWGAAGALGFAAISSTRFTRLEHRHADLNR